MDCRTQERRRRSSPSGRRKTTSIPHPRGQLEKTRARSTAKNSYQLDIFTWNIASLKKRAYVLHGIIKYNSIDVICLQECGVSEEYQPPELPSFITYNLESTNSCVLYVKNSLHHILLEDEKTDGLQYHGVKIYFKNSALKFLNIFNLYAPRNEFNYSELPLCATFQPTFILGDYNARHTNIGDSEFTNRNGRQLLSLLNKNDNVQFVGDLEPTHVYGGILDLCLGFNLDNVRCESYIVKILPSYMLSDHYPRLTTVYIDNN
nr:uncharacterized protein LOC128702167 [Cherax quadricarinatus]